MATTWDSELFEKKFEQRTQELAARRASDKQTTVDKILKRHFDLLGPKTVAKIIQKEYDIVFEDTVEKRNNRSGLLNDAFSKLPGIRVVANNFPVAIESGEPPIEEICKVGGDVYTDGLMPLEDTEDCYEIHLPRGRYGVIGETCQLYGESAERIGSDFAYRLPLSLPTHRIVRLEGISGELWQNPAFSPAGSPLAPAA